MLGLYCQLNEEIAVKINKDSASAGVFWQQEFFAIRADKLIFRIVKVMIWQFNVCVWQCDWLKIAVRRVKREFAGSIKPAIIE